MSTVVVGAKSIEELDDIVAMTHLVVPDEFWVEIESFIQRTIDWERG